MCKAIEENRFLIFTLDMYGTGVLVDDIAKLIEENDLSENVHLCGFCNDKNIFDNYSLLWLTLILKE